MKHEYVSLGSACDTAMIFDRLKIRQTSYPFDWLWNLDTGLESVINIIENDFSSILNKESYAKKYHFRLPNEVIVYKEFPSIIHMHSDPLSSIAAHETLVRRIFRFRELLLSDTKIHFIYYKNYNEELLKDSSRTINLTIKDMLTQAKKFMALIDEKRKLNTKSILLLILQTDIEQQEEANKALSQITTVLDKRISLGFTLSRYDDNIKLHRKWEQAWRSNLIALTEIPTNLRIKIALLFPTQEMKRIVKRIISIKESAITPESLDTALRS